MDLGHSMVIRQANDTDVESIKSLVFSVLNEYGLKPDADTDQDLNSIGTHYNRNGGYFAVVEDNSVIIATVGLRKLDDLTCELRKMYIAPASRGKGLGKRLLELALHKAREFGYRRMTLETATPLKEAINLYKKYGFKPISMCGLSPRCDQAYALDL